MQHNLSLVPPQFIEEESALVGKTINGNRICQELGFEYQYQTQVWWIWPCDYLIGIMTIFWNAGGQLLVPAFQIVTGALWQFHAKGKIVVR